MPSSRFRRVSAALFAIWFTALGVTRGAYMACLDHRAEHLAASRSAQVQRAATGPAQVPDGGNPHAAHTSGAAGTETRMVASDAPADTPEAPPNCTCAGDCCCAVPAQSLPETGIRCAPDARIAPPLPDTARTARPSERIPYVLPFATAPPVAPLLA